MTADRRQVTPVGAVARGIVSGLVGTAAFDTLLFARYRRGGGADSPFEWESSAGVTDWERAPAPAHVGKRLVEGLFRIQLQPSRALKRSNGTTQVTYAGRPLYTFIEDKKPGEDTGTGVKAFGGSFFPLHSNGKKAGH